MCEWGTFNVIFVFAKTRSTLRVGQLTLDISNKCTGGDGAMNVLMLVQDIVSIN